MADKPRIRVQAGQQTRKAFMTRDSFQNLSAALGNVADNLSSGATYSLNPLGRSHTKLEWMYRGSWLVRKVVDCPADDMTRAGIDFGSDIDPQEVDALHSLWTRLGLWNKIRQGIKWGRLYGGAVCVLMIEGQDMSTPLRLEGIAQGSFKGLLVLDRWMLTPDLSNFVTELGPEFGMPMYYDTITDGSVPRLHIHHSRVIRYEGDDVPYWQRIAENGWTCSVIEQLYDRMVAFDSATTGAAQLVYKAHLRTYKVEGLRELLAAGGPMMQAFYDNLNMIRVGQNTEGLTVIDAQDEIEYHTNGAFAGLSDALVQFGQQLSGAAGIPLVILFGQSPTGLNSTGESDVRNYYDRISSAQKMHMQAGIDKLTRVCYWSLKGKAPPAEFGFSFNPLWQMSDTEKATNAGVIATAIKNVYDSGIIDIATALQELKQSGHETGVFTNITDEDIAEAKLAPPPMPGGQVDENGVPMLGHNGGPPMPSAGGPPDASKPSAGPTPGPQHGTPVQPGKNDSDAYVPAQPAANDQDPPPASGMFRLGGTPSNVKVNVARNLPMRVNYNIKDWARLTKPRHRKIDFPE